MRCPIKNLRRALTANEMPSAFRLTSLWANRVGRSTVKEVVSVFPGTLPTIQLSFRTAYKNLRRRRAGHPLSSHKAHVLLVRHRQELFASIKMREIVHLQAGQCGNQIGAKVRKRIWYWQGRRSKVLKSFLEIGRANGLACAVIRLMIAMVRSVQSPGWVILVCRETEKVNFPPLSFGSSGKSSVTNTESTQPEHTKATATFSWTESTSIITRHQVKCSDFRVARYPVSEAAIVIQRLSEGPLLPPPPLRREIFCTRKRAGTNLIRSVLCFWLPGRVSTIQERHKNKT